MGNRSSKAAASLIEDFETPTVNYLSVHIKDAQNIPKKDIFPGLCDPYVVIEYGKFKKVTKVVTCSLSPYWNQEFKFPIQKGVKEVVLTLWDYDYYSNDDLIGVSRMQIASIQKFADGYENHFDVKGLDCVNTAICVQFQWHAEEKKISEKKKKAEKTKVHPKIEAAEEIVVKPVEMTTPVEKEKTPKAAVEAEIKIEIDAHDSPSVVTSEPIESKKSARKALPKAVKEVPVVDTAPIIAATIKVEPPIASPIAAVASKVESPTTADTTVEEVSAPVSPPVIAVAESKQSFEPVTESLTLGHCFGIRTRDVHSHVFFVPETSNKLVYIAASLGVVHGTSSIFF